MKLDELRKLAEAAAAIQGKGLQHIGIMLEFHAGCFPQTVLAMIECIELLRESQDNIGGDWRSRRDAALAKLEQEQGR